MRVCVYACVREQGGECPSRVRVYACARTGQRMLHIAHDAYVAQSR